MNKNFEQYLKLLGINKQEPSLKYLEEITLSHMIRVPFENISKLYYLKKYNLKNIPSLSQFLEGIEKYHFGGTCYANNFYLYQLLKYLGYNVKICGADMKQPDVHIVNIVKVEGREYIVDVGYAAPFIKPLPRNETSDFELNLGKDKYILSPMDSLKRSKLALYRDGNPVHGYLIKPDPREIDDFKKVIKESFNPNAVFMNTMLIVRFGIDYSQVLSNLNYIYSSGKSISKAALKTKDELINMLELTYEIPSNISNIALKDLSMSIDAWS